MNSNAERQSTTTMDIHTVAQVALAWFGRLTLPIDLNHPTAQKE
jgi:hypothetical protein